MEGPRFARRVLAAAWPSAEGAPSSRPTRSPSATPVEGLGDGAPRQALTPKDVTPSSSITGPPNGGHGGGREGPGRCRMPVPVDQAADRAPGYFARAEIPTAEGGAHAFAVRVVTTTEHDAHDPPPREPPLADPLGVAAIVVVSVTGEESRSQASSRRRHELPWAARGGPHERGDFVTPRFHGVFVGMGGTVVEAGERGWARFRRPHP